MTKFITEDNIERTTLDIFKDLEYKIISGPDISPDGVNPERRDYSEIVLIERLKRAIDKINPNIPNEVKEDAIKKILRTDSPKLVLDNRSFHKMLTEGLDVEYRKDGRIVGDKIWLFDFDNPENNEFLAINQFTIIENETNRRPDIILFINGLPVVVIELKNPVDEGATIHSAYNQLQTYKDQIKSLFRFNEVLVISDGLEARAGTITSPENRFMKWKTIDGKESKGKVELEVLIRGMFEKNRLLDIIRHFIVFEDDKEIQKKMAAYHQYHAVNKAVESTIIAAKGNKKGGVVWHTQGSGKSLIMAFYTGKIVLKMDNPTIVVLTDRNDLDDQLFGTFSKCHELLRQKPTQAESRNRLKELLKVSSGGIVFTTIQKFFPDETGEKYPMLSNRDNIIIIADEAHRSQYGFKAKITTKEDKALMKYGYAKYVRDALPNASFIGFTGTPIEKTDRSTPAVFGKYVDVYDIKRAVEDGATVNIFFESRLAKLELKPEERPKIDSEFDSVTELEEEGEREKLKSKWAKMEKVVGAPKRIRRIAKDIVDHFEKKLGVLDGKGMIVSMSRRICVDLYNEIIKIRPEWHSSDDDKGVIKVVMSGSASDPKEWQPHIRNKDKRRAIGDRFKDPKDPLKLVIVRDMWLTGFDAPVLHTMYIDKPMQGHGLMQTIARVNRVYKDKEGGLIVDYIGIGVDLKKALNVYTQSGGKGSPALDQSEIVAVMLDSYEIVSSMFHGFDYKKFFKMNPKERLNLIPQALEHILKQKDGKERYIKETTKLVKTFALAVPDEEAMKIKEEVGFFQAIKSALTKTQTTTGKEKEELDSAIKQILSKSIISDRIIDIFSAAGLNKPNISILDDSFLIEVKDLPQKNLAFEMLKKVLNDEIRIMKKKNLIRSNSFMQMIEKAIKKYTNRSIETAQIIEELIEIAKKMKEEEKRGNKLKMNEDEIAFYDALYVNDSAVKVLGNETLRAIARELVDTVRNNTTIDWSIRESTRAKLRIMVKKVLKRYGYPPDKQKMATEAVLGQAKLLSNNIVEN